MISQISAQAPVDCEARGLKKSDEAIKTRANVSGLKSSERAREESIRVGIIGRVGPCSETRGLATFAKIGAALMFSAGEPLRISESIIAVLGGFGDRDAGAAEHGARTANLARGGRISKFQDLLLASARII